jgi:hypothetical protein
MKKIVQLKITLQETAPPIWRRIQVPEDLNLLQLHLLVQLAMGWTNSHLHEFTIQGQRYGTRFEDSWEPENIDLEEEYTLGEVLPSRGEIFQYLYDFGDGWDHKIEVEEILPRAAALTYPRCLAGARACPPEDVGGTFRYEDFLEVLQDPDDPEYEAYKTWVGGSFDPEDFDLQAVNQTLKTWELSDLVRLHLRYEPSEIGPVLKPYHAIIRWAENLAPDQRSHLEQLPLRRDAVSLLSYLRKHKIKGTSAYGNLPLQAVRETAGLFVNPPVLERSAGDYVWRFRSERQVWPIYFLHTLLEAGGLLTGGRGRLFRLTEKGQRFLRQKSPLQAHFLLETWWFHTNWFSIYEEREVGHPTPVDFTTETLYSLLRQPAGQPSNFFEFADHLCKIGGLRNDNPDPVRAQETLRRWVDNRVMGFLEDFQILKLHRQDQKKSQSTLLSFTLSAAGKEQIFTLAGHS